MVFFRWIFGLPLAGLVTIALFAMMAGLIKIDRGIGEPKETPKIEILPKLVDQDPFPPRTTPPGPERQDPPPTNIPSSPPGKSPGPVFVDPDPTVIDGPEITHSTNIAPLIRYNPPYPDNCRSRGATGIVLVQFDVSPEGNVINARVIDAPDRCFNRIISTVSKWKYPPAYENGRPVTRYGIVERFDFQLTE